MNGQPIISVFGAMCTSFASWLSHLGGSGTGEPIFVAAP